MQLKLLQLQVLNKVIWVFSAKQFLCWIKAICIYKIALIPMEIFLPGKGARYFKNEF